MNIVHELKVNARFRLRLGLLLLGITGLLASAFFFCNHQAAKEASKSAAVTAAAVPATNTDLAAQGQSGKTGLTIIDTTVSSGEVQGQQQKLSSEDASPADVTKLEAGTKKHKLRSSSHRMIATRLGNLPPPPSGLGNTYLPPRQVEMWSGTQKAVVTVAPGTKYEE